MTFKLTSSYPFHTAACALVILTAASCMLTKDKQIPGFSHAGGANTNFSEQSLIPANPAYFLGYWYDEASEKTVRRWMEDRDGMAVIQGDMVLGTVEELSQPGMAKSTFFTSSRLWKQAIVPYILPADFPDRKSVSNAIKQINDQTQIKIRPYQTGDRNWIKFELFPAPVAGKEDPYSNIGGQSRYGCKPTPGEQLIQMNRYGKFDAGTVIHELCHALGQGHEQNRQDRNGFVSIIKENIARNSNGKIPSGTSAQFDILNPGRDYFKYDFDSISHYPPNAFASQGLQTIRARTDLAKGTYVGDPRKFGTRSVLSKGDIDGLNAFYQSEIELR